MPSKRKMRAWHTEFNTLLFDGQLTRCPLHSVPLPPGYAGLCDGDTIVLANWLDDETARATLLHEMVHQWQRETGRPLDHGPSFERWRKPCKLYTGYSL